MCLSNQCKELDNWEISVCYSCLSRMRSTGPGGIKTTRQQSVPETLAVSRRTKYPYVLPTWRERTPPSDRKWPRFGRNSAAVAASLANTRTAWLTSDEGVEQNQEVGEWKPDLRLWMFGVAWQTEWKRWWWWWGGGGGGGQCRWLRWWMYEMRRRLV